MKLFYDLHIHSALSPCGDDDMTPNNIVNMSIIKGLDVIAVSDHNSIKNLYAVLEVARNTDLIVIPAMEVETSENVHMLTLFRDMKSAETVYKLVYDSLPNIVNEKEIYGEQLVLNSFDDIVDYEEKLLVNSANIDMADLVKVVNSVNGIVIPAHIDRTSYSVLNTLGTVPDLGFKCVELSKNANESMYEYLGYKFIRNSDAHYLYDIFEAENLLDCDDKSINALFDSLNK